MLVLRVGCELPSTLSRSARGDRGGAVRMAHSTSEPLDERSLSPQKRPTGTPGARSMPLQLPKAAPPPAPGRETVATPQTSASTRTEAPSAKAAARPLAESAPRPLSPRSNTTAATQFKPASIPSKMTMRPPSPQPRVASAERVPIRLNESRSGGGFGGGVKPQALGMKSSGVIGGVRGTADAHKAEDAMRGTARLITHLPVCSPPALTQCVLPADRREWKLRALKAHPEVRDLKERVAPIDRAVAFGRAYYSNTSEITDTVSQSTIMELVRRRPLCRVTPRFRVTISWLMLYLPDLSAPPIRRPAALCQVPGDRER